ncbi:MAG: FecR domain-containing protein [Tannerellaceae bacterium]|nr:FecR domain-containing protein [Tannerellaceae bacterium]
MHHLLHKYYTKEITTEEKKELFLLLENDPDLKKEFISFQSLGGLSASLPCPGDQVSAATYLKKFRQERRKEQAGRIGKQMLQYAAVVFLTMLASWYLMNPVEETDEIAELYEEFMTPAGQRAMIKLHDGTVVWLNAKSTLRYPNQFGAAERRVELDGEAFFEVNHSEEKPFIVATEKLDVKVLGTQFNVFAYKGHDEFKTSLLEGSVKIYRSSYEEDALFIEPNEYVELIGNRLVKGSFSNADFLLWKDGIYAFDDEPFQEIVKKLELYYDITILINNAKLNEYRFSGKFRQRDGVESVLRTLRKVYYFSYTKDEEGNILTIK